MLVKISKVKTDGSDSFPLGNLDYRESPGCLACFALAGREEEWWRSTCCSCFFLKVGRYRTLIVDYLSKCILLKRLLEQSVGIWKVNWKL